MPPPVASAPPSLTVPPKAEAPADNVEPPKSDVPVLPPNEVDPAPVSDPPDASVPPTPEAPTALLLSEQATATAAPKSKSPIFDTEARIDRFDIYQVLPIEPPTLMISYKSHGELATAAPNWQPGCG